MSGFLCLWKGSCGGQRLAMKQCMWWDCRVVGKIELRWIWKRSWKTKETSWLEFQRSVFFCSFNMRSILAETGFEKLNPVSCFLMVQTREEANRSNTHHLKLEKLKQITHPKTFPNLMVQKQNPNFISARKEVTRNRVQMKTKDWLTWIDQLNAEANPKANLRETKKQLSIFWRDLEILDQGL